MLFSWEEATVVNSNSTGAGICWYLLFPKSEIPLVLGEEEPGSCPHSISCCCTSSLILLPWSWYYTWSGVGREQNRVLPTLYLQPIGNKKEIRNKNWTADWWGSRGRTSSTPSSIHPNEYQPLLLYSSVVVVLYFYPLSAWSDEDNSFCLEKQLKWCGDEKWTKDVHGRLLFIYLHLSVLGSWTLQLEGCFFPVVCSPSCPGINYINDYLASRL